MSLIDSDGLKALDYSFEGGAFCDIAAKTGLGVGTGDWGFEGKPFVSVAPDSDSPIEVSISAGSGVSVAMSPQNLVGVVVSATGISVVFAGEITEKIVSQEHKTGVNAAFVGVNDALIKDLNVGTGVQTQFGFQHLVDSIVSASGVNTEFVAAIDKYGSINPGAGMNAAFEGDILADVLDAETGVLVEFAGEKVIYQPLDAACGTNAGFEGFNWDYFLLTFRDRIQIRYVLTISDGINADIYPPISSFQGRFRTGEPSFLSVVIPGDDLATEIADRASGEIILTMQYIIDGEVYHYEQICAVDIEEIRSDEGASSFSITVSGHRTITHTAKITNVSGASYRAYYGGSLRYRCPPDLFLRPGDTCTINSETFVVGLVTWMVSDNAAVMEIAEED